MHC
jgi:WD40 repeat protein